MGNSDIKIRKSNGGFFSIVNCEINGIQFLTEFQNAIILLDNTKDRSVLQKIYDASATTGHIGKFFRKQIFLLVAHKFWGMENIDYSKY